MSTSAHQVDFFGLSTCIHCKHAREFLEKHRVPFELIYVDELDGDDRAGALNAVRKYNPSISFPTIVVDGGDNVVVGYQPEKLTEVLGL